MIEPEHNRIEWTESFPEPQSPEYATVPAVEPVVLPQAPSFPPWSAWDVAGVLAFTVATIVLMSAIALGAAHLFGGGRHTALGDLASNPIVVIGSQMAAYPLVIAFMMVLVRNKSGLDFWRAIQWNWPGRRAILFLLNGMAFAFLVEFASRYLPIPKSLPVDKYFNDTLGAYLMAIFGITLAPLLEELFFRGMFYPLVRRAAGVAAAVLITATTFAFIHGGQLGYAWAPLASIFVVGLVFTLVRERTGSVAASFLMHCGYNFALFASLWVASDGFLHLDKALN